MGHGHPRAGRTPPPPSHSQDGPENHLRQLRGSFPAASGQTQLLPFGLRLANLLTTLALASARCHTCHPRTCHLSLLPPAPGWVCPDLSGLHPCVLKATCSIILWLSVCSVQLFLLLLVLSRASWTNLVSIDQGKNIFTLWTS